MVRTIKRKILTYFSLTIIILCVAIYYTNYLSPNNYSVKIRHAQTSLSKKEIRCQDAMLELGNKAQSGNLDSLFLQEKYADLYHKEGLLFQVFKDSTLVYWSDNSVIISNKDLVERDNFGLLSNGWYEIRKKEFDNFLVVCLIKIKNNYNYENQYLENEFQKGLNLPANFVISEDQSNYNIYTKEGDFLFSLLPSGIIQISNFQSFLLSSFYLIALVLIIVFIYHCYLLINLYTNKNGLLIVGFVVDVVIFRFLIFYFKIPGILYSLPLFKPTIFASSSFLPSLGDLFLNAIVLLSISYVLFKKLPIQRIFATKNKIQRFILSAFLLVIVFLLFSLLGLTLSNIITNSSISFDLLNITKIDGYSIIAILCFGLLILSFILLTCPVVEAIYKFLSTVKQLILLTGTVLFVFSLLCFFFKFCDGYSIIFIFIYFFYFGIILKAYKTKINTTAVIFFLILFSLFSTYIVFKTNNIIEKETRRMGAQKLANERDFAAEFMFNDITNSIKQDSTLIQLINLYPFTEESELHETIKYLKNNYFNGYWDKYEIQITLCDSSNILDIQPEDYSTPCYDYFNNLIQTYGKPTNIDNFIYLDFSTSPDSYLGIIDMPQSKASVKIYIEAFSRLIPRGLGYPELLMDKKAKSSFNISLYSWAKYENKELVYNYGKYPFTISLEELMDIPKENGFFNLNGYNHLYFPKDDDTILIISKKNPGLIDIAAPFSYFFIFYGLILLLLILIFIRPLHIKHNHINFKKRLQISIVSLVLLSFFIIGISSMFYIISLNNNKNTDLLKEKAHSVLIELEHKLSSEEELSPYMESFLSVLLYKLSLVFFSDINLYDINGTLLATSRNEIFNKGLISPKMNSLAFNQMHNYKSSLYIHQESVGDYYYLSAYLPFRNVQNQTIAYLNLPYFAKQNELTTEIVTYLTAFINIYVILIAIAILITLVISNYISKPVQMLKEKISRLKLGKLNEKIDWVRHDEIGSLVTEYNRMVDELANSAELLAKSERESAWREMAKQIAHEIKNPLTPMKLSVQYLQKSWDEKSPDWDIRIKRFTETLTEQIDSLSTIASEFSDFARIPTSNFEVVELNKIIENAIRLYRDTQSVKFLFTPAEQRLVLADSEQLHRVFINLINNSVQAIADPLQGRITITVETKNGFHEIRFSDNGSGIPEDQKKKVFYPNFTTKTRGMGLGLALVKNIIQNAKGEITFESVEGKGTTFIIQLPVHEGK
jgi:nitrogen fixation/metabolism regulation signal transduction histidine kinase